MEVKLKIAVGQIELNEMMKDYDCNWSAFDIDKHAATYINYLEVNIAPDGTIEYAHPSHQLHLENKVKSKLGDEGFRKWLSDIIDKDYLEELQKLTGYISVWSDFFIGTPNAMQADALLRLKHKKYLRSSSTLYIGDL